MAKLIVSPKAELDSAAIIELLSDKAGARVAASYLRDIVRFLSEYFFFREVVCAVRHWVMTFELL